MASNGRIGRLAKGWQVVKSGLSKPFDCPANDLVYVGSYVLCQTLELVCCTCEHTN